MIHRPTVPKLGGVTNFRDYGGYVTETGEVVRSGRLYRSGHLAEAGAEDIAALAALNIAHVADLRRPEEREKLPTPETLAARWTTLTHNRPNEMKEPPHLAVLLSPDVSAAAIEKRMHVGYRYYPFDPGLSEVYRGYFDALAEQDDDQAVLVHCHAGKDRTGFLIALTHQLLGVSSEALMADYLRTNLENRLEARMPEVLVNFRKDHGVEPPEAALRKVMGVEADYLHSAMTSVVDNAGSLKAYLHDHLGVDEAKTQRIRRRLLRPG
jgi:protein tyrosine/serine phosphatase